MKFGMRTVNRGPSVYSAQMVPLAMVKNAEVNLPAKPQMVPGHPVVPCQLLHRAVRSLIFD